MAPTLFGYAAPPAIQSLSGLGVGVGGTLGTLLVAVAGAVLGGFTLAGVRGPRTRVPARGILSAIGVILPLLAFIRMFPLPEGLGFLVPGLGAGLGAGHWLSKEQLRDSAMG
jgi:hypothetical protein